MNKKIPLYPADILLPKDGFEAWSVIACDQFTSQPEYWRKLEASVGDQPSTLKMILPEVYLEDHPEERTAAINKTMRDYLAADIFREYQNAMIYVERTLPNGSIRRGIVAAVDLEAYDFHKGAVTSIRATEGTVLERIPPRVKIRQKAPLELPHVMLLIDDEAKTVIEPLADSAESYPKLYDFTLAAGGGSICGRLLDNAAQKRIMRAFEPLAEGENPLIFAVGDGNHSLAAAKTCYELNGKNPRNRYALVEIVNIHDPALVFEPIYRVLFHCDPADVMAALRMHATNGEDGQPMCCVTAEGEETVSLARTANLPVGTLQNFLDDYMKTHPNVILDYIHGVDATRSLVREKDRIGFLFDGMKKSELFETVRRDGALPRKTFSMGEATDKRYYLEARRIADDLNRDE